MVAHSRHIHLRPRRFVSGHEFIRAANVSRWNEAERRFSAASRAPSWFVIPRGRQAAGDRLFLTIDNCPPTTVLCHPARRRSRRSRRTCCSQPAGRYLC